MQLIRKGGFRERANRHSRYEDSENKQNQLKPRQYAQLKSQALDPFSAEIESPQAAEGSRSSHELKDSNHIDEKPYSK